VNLAAAAAPTTAAAGPATPTTPSTPAAPATPAPEVAIIAAATAATALSALAESDCASWYKTRRVRHRMGTGAYGDTRAQRVMAQGTQGTASYGDGRLWGRAGAHPRSSKSMCMGVRGLMNRCDRLCSKI